VVHAAAPLPDDDESRSIYAFLNTIGEAFNNRHLISDEVVAADIADAYPDASSDKLYAGLRAHDPQRTRYRLLHLFAAAAHAAPDECALDTLARHWAKHTPLDKLRALDDDRAMPPLAEMERWMRDWLEWLSA
jgi:hypothetical protein